jgi:hypothetical protein
VTIVSPAAGTEVAYDTLTVTATVVGKNGAFIDGNSVQLLIPANNTMGFITAPMSLTAMQDSYQGSIDISSIKSGPSEFTVVAADVNGKNGSASGTYIHDHGPVITFIQPTKLTAHGSIYVQAEIRDTLHPVTDVASVTATVRAGDAIVLTAISGSNPLRVQGTIAFDDYSPELDGPQLLTVTATNSNGTMGRGTKPFTVDNFGPTIKFENPVAGQFIGGVLNIKASIEDISGVNDNSVIAVFGGDLTKSAKLTRTVATSPIFEGVFDVRQLGTNYVLPTLSIRAQDQLGLFGEKGIEIVVDNVPPILSLDPPTDFFLGILAADNTMQCTQNFDPVGADSANDLSIQQQVITLRARVEDNGNNAPGLNVVRVSKVNHSTVYLYAIPAANGPLAVDTDGDGTCDDVNPLLVPTTNVSASNQAVALQLDFIPPFTGNLDLTPSPTPNPRPAKCLVPVGSPTAQTPAPLCLGVGNLELTYAIGYVADEEEPSIWTIPPILNTATQCVGLQFDSLNRMPEGPACFVVVARDNAGNHSVSEPLRICIDRDGNPDGDSCPGWPGAAPNCLGTYDKATMMTAPTACALPATYPAVELRPLLR